MYSDKAHFWVTILLLCVCIPIVGWVIAFISLVRRRRKQKYENRDRLFYVETELQDQVQIHRPNIQKETNVVALEEALFYMDVQDRRTLLLEILKKDLHPYTTFLRKSVNNEDTETAHYAASALTAMHQKTILHLQHQSNIYDSNVVNLNFLIQYQEDLKHQLELGILEQVVETSFRQKSIQACMDLIMLGFAKKQYFIYIINEALKLKDFELANEYCEEMNHHYKDDEETFKMKAKCCYAQRKGKEMQEAMYSLLALKNRTLLTAKQVEYWFTGVQK